MCTERTKCFAFACVPLLRKPEILAIHRVIYSLQMPLDEILSWTVTGTHPCIQMNSLGLGLMASWYAYGLIRCQLLMCGSAMSASASSSQYRGIAVDAIQVCSIFVLTLLHMIGD